MRHSHFQGRVVRTWGEACSEVTVRLPPSLPERAGALEKAVELGLAAYPA